MPDPIKRRHKKHIVNLPRNKSGRERTVFMEFSPNEKARSGSGKIRHYAHPSKTFKGKGKEKNQSIDEALAAGELYEFKSKKRAERFAAGSWKKRAKRKEKRLKKKNNG